MTEQVLWIPGQLPSLNDVIAAAKGQGGRGYGYAKLKANWTNTIALLAKAAKIKPVPSAWFQFLWVERDRRRNPDNIAANKKFVYDGLVLAGVLKNDGWSEVCGWNDSFCVDPKRPGVRISIRAVDVVL